MLLTSLKPPGADSVLLYTHGCFQLRVIRNANERSSSLTPSSSTAIAISLSHQPFRY